MFQKEFYHRFVSSLALPFNQPRFCPNASWDTNATTLATRNRVGAYPIGIFVSSKKSIYVPNRETGEIHIWENESTSTPLKTISGNLSDPVAIFVTINDDIYVDNGKYYGRVDKWIAENSTWVSVMSVSSLCYSLFIDICNSLYCSMANQNKVEKKWPNNTKEIVAGTGVNGFTPDMLDSPRGIFVDTNLDLYVADSNNNRIQLFRFGQRDAKTIAGNGSSTVTIKLRTPSGIILDGDRHLFIADHGSHRIITSDEYGFRCIFGCSHKGSTNDKLDSPRIMSFDSYGNIYVTDQANHRVQKIHLSQKSCRRCQICVLPGNTK